jgi:hypothetical protein
VVTDCTLYNPPYCHGDGISFKDDGIARAIKEGNLFVPPNQREYAWEEKHVRDLYEDIADDYGERFVRIFLGLDCGGEAPQRRARRLRWAAASGATGGPNMPPQASVDKWHLRRGRKSDYLIYFLGGGLFGAGRGI